MNELGVPGLLANRGGDPEVPSLVDSLVKMELGRLPTENQRKPFSPNFVNKIFFPNRSKDIIYLGFLYPFFAHLALA